jgi:hypothetical protein
MIGDEKMKKKAIITGFAVIALAIFVMTIGLTYQPHITAGINAGDLPSIPKIIGLSGPYVLTTSYPVVNETYPIYKTIPPDVKDETVRLYSNLFGLSSNMKKSVTSSNIVRMIDNSRQPAARLTLFSNSGAFTYEIPDKCYSYSTDEQPDLPKDEEARVIATDYLSERNLLPNDVHFKEVAIGSQYGNKTLTSYTLYTLTKLVRFEKEIHGIPVYNAGTTVVIGDKGEVVMVTSSLREFDPKPIRSVKIITPEQAYQRLLSNDLLMKPLSEGNNEIIVTNITLGYWMEIQTEPQSYILPVYAFSCIAVNGAQKEQVMRYVSAIDPSEIRDLS